MAQVQHQTDPVCGMLVNPDAAAAQVAYQGTTYYFCSDGCRRGFEDHPSRYASRGSDAARLAPSSASMPDVPLERHEPPFTKSGGMVAPKFGAAGSGGAEYERLPEAHEETPEDRDVH